MKKTCLQFPGQAIVSGKLSRLHRLDNTKNGNPMFKGQIVTLSGGLVDFVTKPNDQFSYVVGSYVGALAGWSVVWYRGKLRVVGCSFLKIGG